MFLQKTRVFYVDEIDTRCQFHKTFQNFVRKLYFEFEIFGAKISCENRAPKTLMKLTTWVVYKRRHGSPGGHKSFCDDTTVLTRDDGGRGIKLLKLRDVIYGGSFITKIYIRL
jgi:hypothetical protein